MDSAYLLPVALLPVAVMLFYIYKSETFEKEPPRMLVILFILGIISCGPILVVEGMISEDIERDLYMGVIRDQYALAFRMAFICAAFTEEFFKFLFCFIYTWNKKEFNYKFDGIVYAAFTSMGFAATENVAYLFRTQDSQVILLRAVTSIPGHLMFSVFMGYFYGRARYAKSLGNSSGCWGNLVMALLSAIGLHGFYDFCLMTGNPSFVTVFYVFIISMDIFTIVLVRRSAKRNQAIFQAIPLYSGAYVRPVMSGGAAALAAGGYGYGMGPMQQNPGQPSSPYGRPVTRNRVYQPGQLSGPYISGRPAPQPGVKQENSFYIEPELAEEKTVGLFSVDNGLDMSEEATVSLFRLSDQSARKEFQTVGTVGRQDRRFITCPLCGGVNLFDAFHCKSCGASLHIGF